MADKGNVVSLGASGKPDMLNAAIGKLRDCMPGMIEYKRIMAKVQREAYLAYIDAGFTPKQALELVKDVNP